MTNEQILKNIEAAIKFNKETRQSVNEALSQAMNAIKNIDKKFKEEYERGCKDAWDLACDICCSTAFGGMTCEQLEMVFEMSNSVDIMDKYSYENAKKKMEEYLTKKEEEIEKRNRLVIGDVVKVHAISIFLPDHIHDIEAIFCGNDDDHHYVLSKEGDGIQILHKDDWMLIKTGKHVDLNF